MIKGFNVYCEILRPWVCVVVYLWGLELQASYGSDQERVLDRLADASLILWTLLFWLGALCVPLSIIALIRGGRNLIPFNVILCKAILVLISGAFLLRWLYMLGFDPIFGALLSSILLLLFWRVWCHVRASGITKLALPTLEDSFYFGALPIVGLSLLILCGKVTTRDMPRPAETKLLLQHPADNRTSHKEPNVVLVVADALRAQSMSLYGHNKRTTPFLEKFGAHSDVYLSMHANSTTTQTSVTTIISGKHVFSHGRMSREFAPYGEHENLLALLRDKGYYTAAITSNLEAAEVFNGLAPYLSRTQSYRFNFLSLGWVRSFGVPMTGLGGRMYKNLSRVFPILGYPYATSSFGHANDSFRVATSILPGLPEPFFLFIHIHEPHDPHYAPLPSSERYQNTDGLQLQSNLPRYVYRHYPITWQPVADILKARYEESISFMDSELESFVEFVYDQPFSSNLLFIFTADHGESFERGYINHGDELYESSTWIPLLIRFPKQREGRRISTAVQSADLAPTIVNALGDPVPHWMNGRPLKAQNSPELSETIAVNFKHPTADSHYPLPTKLAIWSGKYKLIVSCVDRTGELYDLSKDPDELVDISFKQNDTIEDLKQKLRLGIAMQATDPKLDCKI